MTCSLINEDVKSMTKIKLFSSACLRRNFPNFSTNLDFEFYCRVCCGLHTRSLRCHHKKKSKGLRSGECQTFAVSKEIKCPLNV